MSKITDEVWRLADPIVKDLGCEIWDVEYVKEAGEWYLRVFIDSDAGVSIEQCEAVSRALDPILDEKDPIPDSYIFVVSSAGLERSLKHPSDFERYIGALVEVRLYKAKYGKKEHIGRLSAFNDGTVVITSGGETFEFEKNEVANVRLRVEIGG